MSAVMARIRRGIRSLSLCLGSRMGTMKKKDGVIATWPDFLQVMCTKKVNDILQSHLYAALQKRWNRRSGVDYSYEYGVPCEKSFPATAQQRGIVRVPVAAASSQSVALMMALLKGFLMRLSISQHLGDLGFAICCRLACLAASFGPE